MESTRARVVKLTRSISVIGVVVLTFMLPLLFLPFTMEFYEFNKSILFLAVMLVVLISWLINLAFTGTVSFWKTSFDGWIFGVLAASILGFIFSQSKITSLIAFSGRLSEGIIVLVFLVILTLIIRHVVTKTRVIEILVWTLLASASVVALISILQYFGVYIFEGFERLESTGIRNFTTLGSSSVMPFFMLAVLPVGIGFLVINASKMTKSLMVTVLLMFIMAGFVVSAGSFWAWPGIFLWGVLFGAIGFLMFVFGKVGKSSYKWLAVVAVVTVGMFLVRNVDTVSDRLAFTDDPYVTQPVLQYDVAWRVAASTLSQSPVRGLLGSGPDTFAYTFTAFRPASYNATENWNIRFSRSSSQALEVMGNIGVIGLMAWLVLFAMMIVWLVKTFKENHENPYRIYIQSIGVALVVLMLSFVVTFFTINLWYLFWLFLGMIVAVRAVSNPRIAEKIKLSLSMSREQISVEEHDVLPYVMLVPAILIFVVGVWGIIKIYRAEVYYQNARYNIAQAEPDADPIPLLTDSLQTLADAISEVNFRDSYHADYGILAVNLLLEYSLLAEEEQSEEYQGIQGTLLTLSTESAKKASEIIPINVRNWESRTYVYQELVKITQGGYGDALLSSIDQSIMLDPVKPQLYHQRGVVYSLAGMDEQAVDDLQTSLQLQPLYLPARYDLAMQYQKMGKTEEAIAQLEFILEILDRNGLADTDAYTQVEDAIEAVESGEIPAGDGVPSEEVEFPDEEEISPEEEYSDPGEIEEEEDEGPVPEGPPIE